MKFGIDDRHHRTGADLAVRAYQVASMLPPLFLLILSGYPPLVASKNAVSFLFHLGFSVIPRLETLCLSFIYRETASETVFGLALLILALIVGLLANRFLHGEHGRSTRIVLAVFIALDLVIRLVPLRFNLAMGLPSAIIAFLVQTACLALILLDLRAGRQSAPQNK